MKAVQHLPRPKTTPADPAKGRRRDCVRPGGPILVSEMNHPIVEWSKFAIKNEVFSRGHTQALAEHSFDPNPFKLRSNLASGERGMQRIYPTGVSADFNSILVSESHGPVGTTATRGTCYDSGANTSTRERRDCRNMHSGMRTWRKAHRSSCIESKTISQGFKPGHASPLLAASRNEVRQ